MDRGYGYRAAHYNMLLVILTRESGLAVGRVFRGSAEALRDVSAKPSGLLDHGLPSTSFLSPTTTTTYVAVRRPHLVVSI